MLPPAHLRHGLIRAHAAAAVMPLTTAPRRSLWGYRGTNNWSSHLDPLYHRFHRIRTLKTRAKLLNKLRRRAKFDWDSNAAAFFTPKHVRWASRWDGPSRRKEWLGSQEDDAYERKTNGREEVESTEEAGYELSRREKVWKEQMERMRKRIETDPYEAIFGKRFEPFWSPLVPSWMREEMGLPVWHSRDSSKQAETTDKTDQPGVAEQSATEKASNEVPKNPGVKAVSFKKDPETGKTVREEKILGTPSSFAYAASTSWNSWSNQTKRMEWDSLSGETKTYEYDPISNRMVQIEAPAAAQPKAEESVKSSTGARHSTGSSEEAVEIPVKQPPNVRKAIPIPPPLSQPSNSLPVGFSAKSTSVGPLKSTAVASGAPRPSALANLDDKETRISDVSRNMDLKFLTAESIRAKMPKLNTNSKSTAPPPATNPEQQGEQVSSFNSLDASPHIESLSHARDMLKHRQYTAKHETEWDRAESDVMLERELESLNKKKEKLLNDERGLFHIERQKRELTKLDQRLREVTEKLGRLDISVGATQAASSSHVSARAESTEQIPPLQSSLDRMMSTPRSKAKLALTADEVVDADDAAAHESTERIPASTYDNNVPAQWEHQAELLQADRVKRTSSKLPYPDMQTLITEARKTKAADARGRDVADPELLKSASPASQDKPHLEVDLAKKREEKAVIDRANKIAQARQQLEAEVKEKRNTFEAEATRKKEQETALAERAAKLEKANALLVAEVNEQKSRMQAHESRYAHKLCSLRGELDTAYKQSSVHGQKHVERQRSLEDQIETLRKQAVALNARASSAQDTVEEKYTKKIKALRAELETAYKQSTVHSEKHLERIKDLEAALQKAQAAVKQWAPTPEMAQAEGDLGAGVAKFAGTEKWYKQPATTPQSIKREMEKAAAKRKDRELVNEVRRIYETAYGRIGFEHLPIPYPRTASEAAARETESASTVKEVRPKRPVGVVEVESDVDLGEALANWEKEKDTAAQKKADPHAARLQWEKEKHKFTPLPRSVTDPGLDTALKKEKHSATDNRTDPHTARLQWEDEKHDFVPLPRSETDPGLDAALKKSEREGNLYYGPPSDKESLRLQKEMEKMNYPQVPEETEVDRALAKHDQENKAAAEKRATLAAKEREAHEGVTLLKDTPEAATSSMPIIHWAHPPLYKILAYDAGNDRISIATAPSNFWGKTETPISMAEALGRVYAPAKFVGELATLQEEGWEVVDAGKDVVVFRKVKDMAEMGSNDTGLPDIARSSSQASGATNNTATAASSAEAASEAEAEEEDPFTTIRHYPRVKREEYPVFTGMKRKWGRRHNKEAKESRRERRQRRRRMWRSVIGTGLLAGGVAYTVGSLEEKSRKSQDEFKRLREG